MSLSELADPNCPICAGVGYEFTDTTSFVPTSGRRCACLVRRLAELAGDARLAVADIPAIYAGASTDGFTIRDGTTRVMDPDRKTLVDHPVASYDEINRETVRELEAKPLPAGITVFFSGPPGAGKTYLAFALLRNQMLAHGRSGRWIRADAYIKRLRPGGMDETERTAYVDAIAEADILLIDELGVGKMSKFTMDELFDLLDKRWANQLVTIITSNTSLTASLGLVPGSGSKLTADELETQASGRRIMSRLTENAIKITWPDDTPDFRTVKHAGTNAARRTAQTDGLKAATARARRPAAREFDGGDES